MNDGVGPRKSGAEAEPPTMPAAVTKKKVTIPSGDVFDLPHHVDRPCALAFAFAIEGGSTAQFSVIHRGGKGKTMQLLPVTSCSELSGEVLIPGPGTTIARWYNPAGWFFSSPIDITFAFDLEESGQGHRAPSGSADGARPDEDDEAACEKGAGSYNSC